MALTKIPGELFSVGDLDISDVGTISLDAIQGDADSNTSITFSGSDVITIATGGSNRLTIGDGALSPVTDNQIDLGTSSLEFKDAFFDGTVTSDAFAGPLTGDVTGNVSGTAATVTGAAQSNITSLGTLTTLTVDNVIVNGTTIGHTSDTDLMTLADGVLTVAGEVSMTTLDIGGTNITSTAAELNILDGATVVVGELNYLDLGSTAVGTAIASKAVILDSNKDYTGLRNLTITGELDAATLDISGDVDIDGTLETDNLTVGGAQGSDGQLLTSTGSGVAWEDAPSGGPTHKTFGTGSIMIGDNATGTIDAANYNTGVGVDVFHDLTSGDDNSVFGYRSGFNISSGSGNTFFGYETGSSINTGQRNVVIGWKALDGGDTASDSVMIGYEAGGATVDGLENTCVGYYSGAADMGNYNTFLGSSSGQSNTASNNTIIGSRAGDAVTSGEANTFVGKDSGGAVRAGAENVAVGKEALLSATNSDASNNTAVGTESMKANTSGTQNAAYGKAAMITNTTGNYNTALGPYALKLNVSGSNNTAIGYEALMNANVGDNTAIGYRAGKAADQTRNTYIGYDAGTAQNGSADNMAIGYMALSRQTTGANGNIAIGNYAGRAVVSSASTSQLVAIGHNVASHSSGALAGYQNVFVGYGIADTADLAGAFQNTALGGNAMGNLTTGDHNVGIGHDACHDLTTGIGNVVIGSGAEIYAVDSNYNIIIGYNCKGVNSGDDDYVITMGVSTGSDRIYNLPDSNATWTRVSDVRLKEEIQDNNDCGLAFINDLRPVTFKWKPNSEIPEDFPDYDPEATERKRDNKMYGLIAQEVKEVLDKHNITDFGGWDEMDEGVQTIAQSMFVYPLIKAVQELSTEVEELKKQLENK